MANAAERVQGAPLSEASCPDENALAQLAEGRLPAGAAASVTSHLRTCADCRAVVGALVRTSERLPRSGEVPGEESAPAGLLRQFLAEEAMSRERSASLFTAAVCGAVALLVTALWAFADTGDPVIAALAALPAAWIGAIWLLLRRGWYRPWVPYANVAAEVSAPLVALAGIGALKGPEALAQAPALTVLGGLVVFSAFRANPRVSLLAGALAAAESLVLFALFPAPDLEGFSAAGRSALRALLLLSCGVAGALVARRLVDLGERALRLVREQDLMGKYVLHERIGAGGMAEVYRATYCPEGGFQKAVAVKRVLPEWAGRERFARAFLEEARLGALLTHPNVVQVLDCGKLRGTFILTMELVEGQSLRQLIARKGALPVSAAAYVAAELCAGLDYIHHRRDENGRPLRLVHRDVNPPNVLLSKAGEVKLADFGVASAASRSVVGERDGFYGKTRYAAPEQASLGEIDGRTDLFGLGLTLQEMLRGTPDASIPLPLRELMRALVDPEPSRRPADAATVRARLLELDGAEAPYPDGRTALLELMKEAGNLPAPYFEQSLTAPGVPRSPPVP